MKNSNPKETIGRLIIAGFGVLWTIMVFSLTADSPWPVVKIVFPGFGILFIIAALTGNVSKSKSSDSEESTSTNSSEEVNRKEPPVQTPAPQPRQKKYVFCPYCGTAQEEDYKICESCGAGRNRK